MTTRIAESQSTRTGTWLRYTHRAVALLLLTFGLVMMIVTSVTFLPAIKSTLIAGIEPSVFYETIFVALLVTLGPVWIIYRLARDLAVHFSNSRRH
jgi:hypothetical protein